MESAAASAAVLVNHKRVQRSASGLLDRQDAKRQERAGSEPAAEASSPLLAPLLPHALGESKAAFFARLGRRLRRDLFSAAHSFDAEGIYIYKRAVRSGEGTPKAALLASAGSVFHHVVVYVKRGDELAALDFNPADSGLDITEDIFSEAPAAPVLTVPAPAPEPACLPMLHVAAPCHALDAEHVQKALAFAQAAPYHALSSNCIAFADFICRLLTGGAVRGAPLIYDLLLGQVPPVDSPLLALLSYMRLRWHDVCDGARLMAAFLAHHGTDTLPLPPGADGSLSLLDEPAPGEEGATEAAAPIAAAQSMGSGPLAALLAGFLPPQRGAAATAAAAPSATCDSSSSEDTCGGVEAATPAPTASAAASLSASVFSSASAADSPTPRPAKGGLRLPARGSARSARHG